MCSNGTNLDWVCEVFPWSNGDSTDELFSWSSVRLDNDGNDETINFIKRCQILKINCVHAAIMDSMEGGKQSEIGETFVSIEQCFL